MSTDRQQWLEQVNALLKQSSRGDEAQHSLSAREAGRLDEGIDLADFPDDPEILEAKAALSYKAKRYQEADMLWQRLAGMNPTRADKAWLRAAKSCLEAGDISLAEDRIAQVSTGARTRPRYWKIRADLDYKKRLLDSNHAFARARNAIGETSMTEYLSHAGQALEYAGYGRMEESGFRPLMEQMALFARGDLRDGAPSNTGKRQAPGGLFCAGFGWSGSGAVFDFLRQYHEISVFSCQELALIRNSDTDFQEILDSADSDPERFRARIIDWLAISVFGFASADQPLLDQRNKRRRSLLCTLPQEMAGSGFVNLSVVMKRLAGMLLPGANRYPSLAASSERVVMDSINTMTTEFLRDCDAGMNEGADPGAAFRDSFARYFSRLLALRCGEARYALFNNVIKASELQLLSAFPGDARAIVVFRDPRDIFVDRIARGKHWTVATFIKNYKSKMKRYSELVAMPGIADKVIPVWFEEIVLDEACRRQLLEDLAMTEDARTREEITFIPEKSRRNIGIYKQFSDQGAIARIESELKDHLLEYA